MKYHFHPPRHDPLVIPLINLFYFPIARLRDHVTRVSAPAEDWGRIEALRGHGAILTPNHPSLTEPVVMGWVARQLHQPLFYVATHELFSGREGWFAQRVGAFSIIRGRADLSAARMSRHVLADLDRLLVMFPEGETHMVNNLIIPLHTGPVGFGFAALKHRARIGKSLHLPLLPVIIKYRYVGNPRPVLTRGIARLEHQLGLPAAIGLDLRDRILRAGFCVLAGVEREYGVHTLGPDGAPAAADDRIHALNKFITERVAHTLHVRVPEELTTPNRMRLLFNATYDYLDGLKAGRTAYERRLHSRRLTAARACLNDLWRLQNFMVISADYLPHPLIAERLGELLYRLEIEVFGGPRTVPYREALIRTGEAVDLADYFPRYLENPRATLRAATLELEAGMRAVLDSMASLSTPLE